MSSTDWLKIAKDVADNYDEYDAFIVLHGTDTMAYTASALSFILCNLGKSVIVTGSQIPITQPLSDGVSNLLGSLACSAQLAIPEASVVVVARVRLCVGGKGSGWAWRRRRGGRSRTMQ
jgi:L-asparaginase